MASGDAQLPGHSLTIALTIASGDNECQMPRGQSSVSPWGAVLLLCTVAALLLVLFPIWVIRPFVTQHPAGLAFALQCLRLAPLVTVLTLIAGLGAGLALWRVNRTAGKKRLATQAAVVTAVLLLTASATLARINIFERMFNPVKSVKFLPIAGTVVDPRDMVMAVNISGQSHAYPIRTMAYHHVVNDLVGGLPVVATY